MNIFLLDEDLAKAAEYHCDKHVVKMILEYAQLLSTACHEHNAGEDWMYKSTHVNHPCAIWARATRDNFRALHMLAMLTLHEYEKRYNNTAHKTKPLLKRIISKALVIPDGLYTPPPKCMPDEYKIAGDTFTATVASYRNYYFADKYKIAKWAYSETPTWFLEKHF